MLTPELVVQRVRQVSGRAVVFQKAAQVGFSTMRRLYVEWLIDQMTTAPAARPGRLRQMTLAVRSVMEGHYADT